MAQDFSTEWRAALIERDMAVRAIVEFLDALGKPLSEAPPFHEAPTFEVMYSENLPGTVPDTVLPRQFPEFDMLKRVRLQLEKKLKR